MKKHLWAFIMMGLYACSPEPLETRRVALTAILTSGEAVDGVSVFLAGEDDAEEFRKVTDASVYVIDQNGLQTALSFNGQGYGNPGLIVEEGAVYRLSCSTSGLTCQAEVEAPVSPELWLMTDTPFSANITNVFAPVFTVSWLGPQNHSYLLALEEVLMGDTIRPGEVGTFKENFNGPFDNLQLTLTTADFTCYGRYRLHITAIDKLYSELWLDDEPNVDGMLKSGVTNVTNGFGYVTAVSNLVIPIEINP